MQLTPEFIMAVFGVTFDAVEAMEKHSCDYEQKFGDKQWSQLKAKEHKSTLLDILVAGDGYFWVSIDMSKPHVNECTLLKDDGRFHGSPHFPVVFTN